MRAERPAEHLLRRARGLDQPLERDARLDAHLMQHRDEILGGDVPGGTRGERAASELAEGGKVIPPLFVWLVASSGEDWAGGFAQAARVYYERALQRVETLLYAALPISVLALAFLIVGQIIPMVRIFTDVMSALGNMDGQ